MSIGTLDGHLGCGAPVAFGALGMPLVVELLDHMGRPLGSVLGCYVPTEAAAFTVWRARLRAGG